MQEEGLYSQTIPDTEIEGLQDIYWFSVLRKVLKEKINLKKKKFLDVGAGSSNSVGKYVVDCGGFYTAVDINEQLLKSLNASLTKDGINFCSAIGDIRSLQFLDNAFDIVYEGLVLMNIASETRAKAIQELIRVSKDVVVLIELNWQSMRASRKRDRRLLEEFSSLASEILPKTTDFYFGGKLSNLLEGSIPKNAFSVERFELQESEAHNNFLLSAIMRLSGVAEKFCPSKQERCEKLYKTLSKAPIAHTPPAVIVVIISKPKLKK